jgi:outer membrane protein assembly factor BamB
MPFRLQCRSGVLAGSTLATVALAVFAACQAGTEPAAGGKDWPMFGGTPARNMVNPVAKNVPDEWTAEEGKQKNIKWVAALGSKAYGGPVIAGGRVFVGTNNGVPRDPKIKGPRGVVMCFDEKTGKFLWQAVHDMPAPDIVRDALNDGMCSTPTADGDRLYFVTPACVVVCADAATGKTLWQLDTMKELKVYPSFLSNCAPLVVGDLVFVITGNGRDGEGMLPAPKAPSFVAVHKKDGKLAWRSSLPGARIIDGQWSNPAYAVVNGKPQVIFPGGDGYLYGLEPQTGEMIWKFNCNPTKARADSKFIPGYLVATPVVYDNKVYVGIGTYPENPMPLRVGHFWCVDLTKKGDVSPVNDNWDPQAPENKNSALVWHYGGSIEPRPKVGRPVVFGSTISTCAIKDDLVYLAEELGYLHCLDAKTGKKYWEHDMKAAIWGSPYWVDGKIYQGVEDGVIYVFAEGKKKTLLHENDMGEAVQSTPVVANDVLYILTKSKLYAIRNAK